MKETKMNTATANPAIETLQDPDALIDKTALKFRFKKDKLGNQRPTIELNADVPSYDGIIEILRKGGKEYDLMKEAIADVVRSAYTAYFGDNETATAKEAAAATVKFKIKDENGVESEKEAPMFSWEGIAYQPASDRRASTISDEDWTAFSDEYSTIMPALTAKTLEQINTALFVFTKKLLPVKTNKEVLKMLQSQFAIFVQNTKKGEQFAEIVELINRKFDVYLTANDTELLIKNL